MKGIDTMAGAAKRNVLVVSPVFPLPVNDGFTLRVMDMAAYLKRSYRLSFVVLSPEKVSRERVQALLETAGQVEVVIDPVAKRGPVAACRRLFCRICGRLQRPRPTWSRYCPPALTRAVGRVVAAQDISVVVVNTAVLAPSVATVRSPVFTAIDTHDVWHERYRDFAAMGQGAQLEHFRDPADEARLLNLSDLVVAITETDAAVFARLVPEKKVVVAGVSRPVKELDRSPEEGPPLVLFVGGRGRTNEDAVTYFIGEIWPHLTERVTGAQFCVLSAGERLMRAYAGYPGIRLLGAQDDLSDWYRRAHVVVDPLRYGTGLKIKVVEALSYGSALVMTSVAARGIPGRRDHDYLVRDDPAAFAAAVADLLEDIHLRQTFRKRAHALAREAFAPDRVYADLMAALPGQGASEPKGSGGSGPPPKR